MSTPGGPGPRLDPEPGRGAPGFWHRRIRFAGSELVVGALAGTVLLGLVGAGLAHAIGLPLPWLSGAVIAVAAAAIGGLRIAGAPPSFPVSLRFALVPIVGVAIGGAFTPELIEEAGRWWITLLGLALYIPASHALGYVLYRRIGGYDRNTAYFAAMPGGLIEAVAMGEQAGGDPKVLTLLQFSRLIICILFVPLGIMLYEGHAVGSAAGIELGGPETAMGFVDAILLTAAGAIGFLGGRRLGLPAAVITGPILASGALHLAGITEAMPPAFLIALTQFVVGLGLGVRFVGMARGPAMRGLGMAALSVGAAILLALAIGGALHGIVRETAEAVVLAFAPGGVTEMSLVALSLQISVVFVSAHHVVRILLCVFFAKIGHNWLVRHRGWSDGGQASSTS